jgi:hypothetical protein
MPDKGWHRRFDDPIRLPDGRQLVTLRDAGDYIVSLSKAEQNGTLERFMSLRVRRSMDTQTKREIWLLTLGTIIIEVPVAFAAFAVFTH